MEGVVFTILSIVRRPLGLLPPLGILSKGTLIEVLPNGSRVLMYHVLPRLIALNVRTMSIGLRQNKRSYVGVTFGLFLFRGLRLPRSFLLPWIPHYKCGAPGTATRGPIRNNYPVPVRS